MTSNIRHAATTVASAVPGALSQVTGAPDAGDAHAPEDRGTSDRQHAVVSGVSSGIGLAIAQRLLNDGWRVTGLCRSKHIAALADHEAAGRLSIVPVDLGNPLQRREVAATLAPADALVHAAGLMRTAPAGELDPAALASMWEVHVAAAADLADALLPRMIPGGRVVLIGSRTANGAAGRSQYAATKAALVGMARSWAGEAITRGITVNVVAPGATDTPFLNGAGRSGTPPRMPPLGRFVHPDEVAALTAFLLGDAAAAITGQQIVMCGGASL
ncbi:NAD(P)-dependent dehydrogenase (short-subunit alcohol dehydrogenase family) [Robbsia andropogonis]